MKLISIQFLKFLTNSYILIDHAHSSSPVAFAPDPCDRRENIRNHEFYAPYSLSGQTLYNCYTDQLIPGITLWNEGDRELKSAIKRAMPSLNHEIIIEDTIEKKYSLGLNADLKLSLISELLEIEGAAKYSSDVKSSENQSRVTLHYSATTHSEQLALNLLGPVQHSRALDDQKATHVVVEIKYGLYLITSSAAAKVRRSLGK